MNATSATLDHPVVSKTEWLRARVELLAKEKELTRLNDELSRQRQELPWTRVEKQYVFESPQGKLSLADLFDGRSQLATYHFMFGPDWVEGCPGCSYLTDHMDGALEHLRARDVSLVLVSRGPLDKLAAFKQRMGWHIPWVSSAGCDFNRDFGVTFTKEEAASGAKAYNFGTIPPHGEECPGLSFFYKDSSGAVLHTYSTFARGLEPVVAAYAILDRAPKGRDEASLPSPMAWLRHHDKYEPTSSGAGHVATKKSATSRPLLWSRRPVLAPAPGRGRAIVAGAFSLGVWTLMPKCPLCLAAHVALWTGLGLSIAQATYLRWSLLCLAGTLLLYVAIKRAIKYAMKRTHCTPVRANVTVSLQPTSRRRAAC